MSQLLLQDVSREILDRAEESVVPAPQLGRLVDDYFVERLKREELDFSHENARLYDGMRQLLKTELGPLYADYLATVGQIRETKGRQRVWHYVLGTVVVLEVLAAVVTRGRSLAPQVLLMTSVVNAMLGLLIYTATQYVYDRQLARARRRLEKSILLLGRKLETDIAYDERRGLLEGDVLRAEALELLARYAEPRDFWRDYQRAREADPTSPAALARLNLPAFESFLKPHTEGTLSSVARQDRFNRLFLAAHETFLARDREGYALRHLSAAAPAAKSPIP
ncbi:MAG: hypothetical protein IPM17_11755 [Verrucomicrobia bacterium]|jgi:hypothetical protein|nr:hypothetical protein [Verrucomicrobiota bacterium]